MAQQIRLVVEIEDLKVDGRREVLKLLNGATAKDHVQWTAVEVNGGVPHQSAAEVIFTAVTTTIAEQLIVKVEEVVGQWCRQGLNKIKHRVRVEPVEPVEPVESVESVEPLEPAEHPGEAEK